MSYHVVETGDENDMSYRLFLADDQGLVSPFHDIPLVASEQNGEKVFNMLVEIPKGTNAKMEITLDEKWNPIKQDTKKGKLRFVDDVLPWKGYLWNYGAFPQTWEDPTHKHPETGCFGDCDPLDVCEIGEAVGFRGQVKQVKVLGVIALIDEGETDWKVIVIDVNDPRASEMNDIEDVDRLMPGFTFTIYEWLRTYKMPAGKPPNEFAFDGAARNKEYALGVVEENHQFWKRLISKEIPNTHDKYKIDTTTRLADSPYKVEAEAAPASNATRRAAGERDALAFKNAVHEHCVQQQLEKPHGDSGVAPALGVIADAILNGSVDGLAIDGYTVATSSSGSSASVGLYRGKTPFAPKFAHTESLGALEVVAAAFGEFGKSFTYASGVGRFSFQKGEGGFELGGDVSLPESVADAENLNGDAAPLAFLRSQSA